VKPKYPARQLFLISPLHSDFIQQVYRALTFENLCQAFLTDHHGVSFMVHHLASVFSVSPSRSGLLGGMRITIKGSGFSNHRETVEVRVADQPCAVQTATMSQIECVLATRTAEEYRNSTARQLVGGGGGTCSQGQGGCGVGFGIPVAAPRFRACETILCFLLQM
jgi:hypothetical protein